MEHIRENIANNLKILKTRLMQVGQISQAYLCTQIILSVRQMGNEQGPLLHMDDSIQRCLQTLYDNSNNPGDLDTVIMYRSMYTTFLGLLYLSKLSVEQPEEEVEDLQEAEEAWDEFSVSSHESESGYGGSMSDLSETTSFCSLTDEIRYNEQCHFGFLVREEHVRQVQPLGGEAEHPRASFRLGQSDILKWLEDNESFNSDRKRKLEEVEDTESVDFPTKRRKVLRAVRRNRSDCCLFAKDSREGQTSSSDTCLFVS